MDNFAMNVARILTKFRVKTFRGGLLVFSPQRIIFPFVTKNMKVMFYEFGLALYITGRFSRRVCRGRYLGLK
jgi:hypothetical protein